MAVGGVADTFVEGVAVAGSPQGGLVTIQGDPLGSAVNVSPVARTTLHLAAGAANAISTVTLPAPGAGLFHYITRIRLYRSATAAVVGNALLGYGSTNLSAFGVSVGNLIAAGQTLIDFDCEFALPWRSAVSATASTISTPAGGVGCYTIAQVWYYVA